MVTHLKDLEGNDLARKTKIFMFHQTVNVQEVQGRRINTCQPEWLDKSNEIQQKKSQRLKSSTRLKFKRYI